MRTARSISCPGVSTRHPLGADPPGADPPGADPQEQAPPPAARHAGIAHPPLQGMLGYQLQCMLGY